MTNICYLRPLGLVYKSVLLSYLTDSVVCKFSLCKKVSYKKIGESTRKEIRDRVGLPVPYLFVLRLNAAFSKRPTSESAAGMLSGNRRLKSLVGLRKDVEQRNYEWKTFRTESVSDWYLT